MAENRDKQASSREGLKRRRLKTQPPHASRLYTDDEIVRMAEEVGRQAARSGAVATATDSSKRD